MAVWLCAAVDVGVGVLGTSSPRSFLGVQVGGGMWAGSLISAAHSCVAYACVELCMPDSLS